LTYSMFLLPAKPGILAQMRIRSVARNARSFTRELHLRVLPKRGEQRFPPRK
jgi:hypothetical protein